MLDCCGKGRLELRHDIVTPVLAAVTQTVDELGDPATQSQDE